MKQLAFDFCQEKRCSKCNQTKSLDNFYKHRSMSDGYTYECKECRDHRTREYRAKNPDKIKAIDLRSYSKHRESRKQQMHINYLEHREERIAYARKNRIENREKCKEQSRQSYAKHREKKNAQHRKYYQEHRIELLAQKSKYQIEHREERRIYERQYRKRNRDKRIANNIRRRARKAEIGGSFTTEEWQTLCNKFGNRCLCCGSEEPLTVDHIIPIAEGGTSDISNCQPLCQICNSRKGIKTIDYRPSISSCAPELSQSG